MQMREASERSRGKKKKSPVLDRREKYQPIRLAFTQPISSEIITCVRLAGSHQDPRQIPRFFPHSPPLHSGSKMKAGSPQLVPLHISRSANVLFSPSHSHFSLLAFGVFCFFCMLGIPVRTDSLTSPAFEGGGDRRFERGGGGTCVLAKGPA